MPEQPSTPNPAPDAPAGPGNNPEDHVTAPDVVRKHWVGGQSTPGSAGHAAWRGGQAPGAPDEAVQPPHPQPEPEDEPAT